MTTKFVIHHSPILKGRSKFKALRMPHKKLFQRLLCFLVSIYLEMFQK